eukprot:CAMPEP_0172323734 /NCGR_PEP_ID=MMETSP1058-20130122/49452_1 /TAXON_ID=83371 /ORGANISM="Detonula confervacea, Strain CCMP 353" /LENGTH=413 /DNA_ID=CAMNT_0013039813 /DNA_START=194 /DNA_END=1435 /DNA_ORIENTATION=-
MRRDNSATSLSPSSPASFSERCCDYRKLNLLAFAGTLAYIGYIFGGMEKSGEIPLRRFVSRDNGSSDDRAMLRATSSDAVASWDRISEQRNGKKANEEEESSSLDEKIVEKKPVVAYAKGPVIHKNMGPVTSINLLGERHSGTNWITDHLVDCFGDQIPVQTDFTRFKHWFQFDDATVRNDNALVIAMFRDPYDWVEAMHERPHHAHDHIGMGWKDFVTKPWVGSRGPADHTKMEKAKAEGFRIEKWGCLAGYNFDEVIPCSAEDSVKKDGYSSLMYELKHDGSHRAYNSVIELRTQKILNFLQVPTFHGVKAFFPERYEALNMRGTADFLKQLEEVTGLTANCKPFPGTGVVKHKNVEKEYTEWMNIYHDWDVEAMIGYVKREPIPRKDEPLSVEQEEMIAYPSPPSNAQIK